MNNGTGWIIAALLGFTTLAHAAGSTQGFAVNQFDPAERGSDWFALDSLDLQGSLRPAAGLTLDWGEKPLVAYDPQGKAQATIIDHQLFAHLGASVVLFDRLRLGFNLPVLLSESGRALTVSSSDLPSPGGFAAGDLRFGADVRLVGRHADPFTLAAGGQIFVPIGSASSYTSDGSVRGNVHVLAAGQVAWFVYGARVGVEGRSARDLGNASRLGSEVQLGASAGVSPLDDGALTIGPELTTASVLGGGTFLQGANTPLELLLGAHYRWRSWRVGAAFGPGLTEAVGTPEFRTLLSLEWAPPADRDDDGIEDAHDACPDTPGVANPDPALNGCPPDGDHDGIPDAHDACPTVPGVASLDPAQNGCPPDQDGDRIPDLQDACPTVAGVTSPDPKKNGCPADQDGDGIPDGKDACPTVAGVASPDPKKNGCPADQDGDGIPDGKDACPTVAGIASPDPKKNGCPADQDGDGIPDAQDACPTVPGAANADPKKNGCPADRDGDGVPDALDNCPDEPGDPANQGCPKKTKQLVVIRADRIEILDRIFFDTGKATIQPRSFALLEQIASVIGSHPQLKLVRIEGHTDNVGKDEFNRKLSQDRADAVRAFLLKKGIDPDRLAAAGYGPDRPIDSNDTEAGRARNRRVEFRIDPH